MGSETVGNRKTADSRIRDEDPPAPEEMISTSKSQSLDRAGAIAVFPFDSKHSTQRRSITRRMSDSDISFLTQTANNEDASEKSYDEIPVPPASHIIDATVEVNSAALSTQPCDTSRDNSLGTSVAHSNEDETYLNNVNVQDIESGTVTAKAISSEDYYAEVKRQVEQEAVLADVIPAAEIGRSETTNATEKKRRRRKSVVKDFEGQLRREILRQNKGACLGFLVGLVLVLLLFIFMALMR